MSQAIGVVMGMLKECKYLDRFAIQLNEEDTRVKGPPK
jgi:hypothetical protein